MTRPPEPTLTPPDGASPPYPRRRWLFDLAALRSPSLRLRRWRGKRSDKRARARQEGVQFYPGAW